MTLYLKLFWSFFQVGLFSIGGGYAAMPLIQNQVVDLNGWLTIGEFTDLITIAEMTPGPIAVNSATFVGMQIAGFAGAVVATIGCIFPSCIIVSILAFLYFKYKNLSVIQGVLSGLRPAVVAFIASAGLSILILAFWGEGGFSLSVRGIQWISVAIFICALVYLRVKKCSPIPVMLACGIVGGILYNI